MLNRLDAQDKSTSLEMHLVILLAKEIKLQRISYVYFVHA